MIKGYVKGQDLKVIHTKVVTGTRNYLEMMIDFRSKDWDGLSKWVHFRDSQGQTIPPQMLDANNMITKDRGLNLTTGTWTVWLHGTSSSEAGEDVTRVTTDECAIEVENTGIDGDHPLGDIGTSVAEQLDSKIQDAVNKANDSNQKATQALEEVQKVKPLSDEAVKAASEAKESAQQASSSALEAKTSASNAYNSAIVASNAANASGSSAIDAHNEANRAEQNARSSDENASKAAESARVAGVSETAAVNAASQAKQSAESANNAKDTVHTDADRASKAAESAESSANSASNSARDAVKARDTASVHASDSKWYHEKIIQLNQNVIDNALRAEESESEARKSATAAEASADLAKGSETIVAQNAEKAQQAAEAATASAGAAKQSETNAKGSETSASSSEQKASQALSDLLKMIGKDIPTLDAGGKIPVDQIPATATQEIYVVQSESELTGLNAQRGDLAELIGPVADEKTRAITKRILKTWQCLGDPTSLKNWVEWGTSYAVQAGNATNAQNAVDSTKINGHRMVEMEKDAFETAVKDPTTYYLVHDPKSEV